MGPKRHPATMASPQTAPPIQTDYPWQFLGDPYLDGALVARGVRMSVRRAFVRANDLPGPLLEDLMARFEQAGCRVQFKEVPNRVTRDIDAQVRLEHEAPRFGALPAFHERRLDPERLPRRFLEGWAVLACRPMAAGERYRGSRLEEDRIRVRPARGRGIPDDDVRALLGRLGVRGWDLDAGSLILRPDHYQGVPVFDHLVEANRDEERQFLGSTDGRSPDALFLDEVFRNPGRVGLRAAARRIWDRRRYALGLLRSTLDAESVLMVRAPPWGLPGGRDTDELLRRDLHLLWAEAIEDGQLHATTDRLEVLVRRYEQALQAYAAVSEEARRLRATRRRLLAGASELPDGPLAAEALIPTQDERGPRLARFFARHMEPEWFFRDTQGRLFIQRDAVHAARRQSRRGWRRFEERLAVHAALLFEWMDGYHFGSEAANNGTLDPCPSCDESFTWPSHAACAACDAPLCVLCVQLQRGQGLPGRPRADGSSTRRWQCIPHRAVEAIHRSGPAKPARPGIVPVHTLRARARRQPGARRA